MAVLAELPPLNFVKLSLQACRCAALATQPLDLNCVALRASNFSRAITLVGCPCGAKGA